MAAPTIQSSTTLTWSNTTTANFTKPTGLSVGDLMVALIYGGTPTLAGWTTYNSSTLYILYKIADSSDVAAPSFSFSLGGTVYRAGVLFRITGHAASLPIGNTLVQSSTDSLGDTANPTTGTIAWSTVANDALIFFTYVGAEGTGGTVDATAYTFSGTNPTWTEYLDATTGPGDLVISIAAGTITTKRTITSASITYDGLVANASTFILTTLPAQADISETPSSFALTIEQSVPITSTDVNETSESIALTLDQSAPTVQDKSRDWTTRTKGEATWTPRTK